MIYQFSDRPNTKAFFWFEKRIVEEMTWAGLITAAKSIWPVIACHANQSGVAFPSERRIAILSGLSDKVVRKGIKDLEKSSLFKVKNYVTKRGKRSKRFIIKMQKGKNRGRSFPFHRYILESGIWRELKPTAKALYISIRCFSYFCYDYCMDEQDDIGVEPGDMFRLRSIEWCEAERDVLIKYSGINRNSFLNALENLEKNNLVELEDETGQLYVYLRAKDGFFYKRDFLNNKIKTSYKHVMHKKYRS